jgi:hypothetical protein
LSKYNIELRTEKRVSDTLTVESADQTALRIQVAQFVGELLKEHAGKIWADEDWRVDVTDNNGLILYVMHISAVQAPAVANAAPSGRALSLSSNSTGTHAVALAFARGQGEKHG